MVIDGKKIAEDIIGGLKLQPKPNKILAAILAGENPISINFLEQKKKIAEQLRIDFRIYKFPENSSSDDLRKEIRKITLLKRVGGAIIQLPLPERLNRQYILNVIPREKDVDVLGERALGAFYVGRNPVSPPSVATVQEILSLREIWRSQINSCKVAVVGAGFLIGKPITTWFMGKAKELYLLDIGSDLSILKQADLIISGVGKAGLIKPEMLKENAAVIDFGISVGEDGRIYGDFDSTVIKNLKFKIKNLMHTPTPGGTGPILVAKIFENFYALNKYERGLFSNEKIFSII